MINFDRSFDIIATFVTPWNKAGTYVPFNLLWKVSKMVTGRVFQWFIPTLVCEYNCDIHQNNCRKKDISTCDITRVFLICSFYFCLKFKTNESTGSAFAGSAFAGSAVKGRSKGLFFWTRSTWRQKSNSLPSPPGNEFSALSQDHQPRRLE